MVELRATWKASTRLNTRLQDFETRLYAARTLIPNQYEPFFRQRARYENANSSTNIEGNPINGQQAFLVLAEGSDPTKPAEIEKTNLDEAYELMTQLAKDKTIRFDAGVIRSMHSIVLRGLTGRAAQQRGQYRTGGVAIQEANTKEIRYLAPSHLAVPELMDGFVNRVQDEITKDTHPVIVAALVHFGLISIHPFLDANGRIARLMADLILHLKDKDADGMLATSPVFFDHRAGYYDILHRVQGGAFRQEIEISEFITFHAGMALKAAAKLEESAVALNRRLDELKKQTSEILNNRQCLGLLYLFDLEQISTMTYAKLVKTSRPTAAKDLSDMVDMDLIVRVGSGRNTKHELHPQFRQEPTVSEGSTSESTTPERAHAMAE